MSADAQLVASMQTALHFLQHPVPPDELPDYLRKHVEPAAHESRELVVVKRLLDRGFKLVFWPAVGEAKGPTDRGWLERGAEGRYTLSDFRDGMRVGIMHGVEIADGKVVCDVDIDYRPGMDAALAMLPTTRFMWGRKSKDVSHLLYTVEQTAPPLVFKDVGKNPVTLIEFRPDLHQCMAPPSVWQKDGTRERLEFRAFDTLSHFTHDDLKRQVTLAAVTMLLAKHLGTDGFGHEPRLAWAGFLMRLGLTDDELQQMGETLSKACRNREVNDVRRVIQSTRSNLNVENKKVKGGPALAKIIGPNGRAVVTRIREWLGRDADFIRDKDGKVVAKSQENIARAIERLDVTLMFDEFAHRMMIQEGDGKPEHLEDSHVEDLYFRIDAEFRFMPPYEFFTQKIRHIARQNTCHPVREYLDSLRWDRVPRIDAWMATYCGAADTPYNRAISAIMLKAAVKRAYEPGCKYDEMVVWESPQGTGKSSMARTLCPHDEWFSDDLPLTSDSKVLIEKTVGKWIIEVSELAGKRKAEQEQLKATLSRQVDGPARMAFGKFSTERPRQFILLGTTNLKNYLSDPTGGRRWWPIKVTNMDLEGVAAVRDQLWAEAVVRVKAGESIRLPEDLWPAAEHEQAKRTQDDPWEETIKIVLRNTTPSSDGKRRVVTDAIWASLGFTDDTKRDRLGAMRIADIMQKLGFERKSVRDADGNSKPGYVGVFEERAADDDSDAVIDDSPF